MCVRVCASLCVLQVMSVGSRVWGAGCRVCVGALVFFPVFSSFFLPSPPSPLTDPPSAGPRPSAVSSTPAAHTFFSCTVVAQTCCQSVQSHIDPMRMAQVTMHIVCGSPKNTHFIAQCRTSRHT